MAGKETYQSNEKTIYAEQEDEAKENNSEKSELEQKMSGNGCHNQKKPPTKKEKKHMTQESM